MIGPNGAGKTTLLDVICGITRPKQGRVIFDDATDITRASKSAIARAGVRRKFQKPSIFEGLSVRQHIDVGRARRPAALAVEGGASGPGRQRCLKRSALAILRNRSASELAHGQKQWLEIGMVLASNPKVLMLDEPVAGLTDEETERTVALVRSLKRPDRAIVVVEHDMDFVERIADRVTVLHEGKTFSKAQWPMHGPTSASSTYIWDDTMRFRVEGLDQHYGSAQVLRRVGLRDLPGECLAVLGRNGAGKTTLLKCLMGVLPVTRGRVLVDETEIIGMASHRRSAAGLGLCAAGSRNLLRIDRRRKHRGRGARTRHVRHSDDGGDHRFVSGAEADVAAPRRRAVRRAAAATRDCARAW